MRHQLAQVNIGRLAAPADSPQLAAFFDALDPVNAAADAAPGFVWRLQTEEGNATAIVAFQWDRADSDGVLVNMSVWESVDALAHFVYSDTHRAILRQRRSFFQVIREATTCMWWVPEGERPSIQDAEDRVRHIREHGPTPYSFTFHHPFGPPEGVHPHEPRAGRPEWPCPA